MFTKMRSYIPSIITALIGIGVFITVPYQIDLTRLRGVNLSGMDPRTLPYFLALSIVALSLLEMNQKRRKNKIEKLDKTPVKINPKKYIRVFITFVGIVLWVALVPYLGFILMTTLLLGAVMLIMGNKKWLQVLLVPILTSLLLNYVFSTFVGRTLPTGIFF